MLTVRRDNPNAARSRTKKVPFLIYSHAIRSTGQRIAVHINKYFSIRDGAVFLKLVPKDQFLGRCVCIEVFLVWRERYTVGRWIVFNEQIDFPRFDSEYACKTDFQGLTSSWSGVCEVDRSIRFNNYIISSVQALALICACENSTCARALVKIRARRKGQDFVIAINPLSCRVSLPAFTASGNDYQPCEPIRVSENFIEAL